MPELRFYHVTWCQLFDTYNTWISSHLLIKAYNFTWYCCWFSICGTENRVKLNWISPKLEQSSNFALETLLPCLPYTSYLLETVSCKSNIILPRISWITNHSDTTTILWICNSSFQFRFTNWKLPKLPSFQLQ